MRVLVAPDKFKGTLSAPQAASAIAMGWRRARPQDDVREAPMADGGEGTLDALLDALGGERRSVRVSGPLGDPVLAEYGVARRGARRTAIVETARASGLQLLGPRRRDPLRATTFGTGELLLAASREDVDEVLVGVGGSATNDAGVGMAQALGVRLLDEAGRPVGRGGGGLLDVARVDLTALDPTAARTRFVAAADVDSPLTGPLGASVVYGPQKGASPGDVVLLDRALAHLAAVVARDLGVDVRTLPGGGSGGGLGAGLVAFLGARLRPGAEVLMEALGLHRLLPRSDLVVTGEGRFDEQSLHGKVTGSILGAAGMAGVRVVVLCGETRIVVPGVRVAALVDRVGRRAAVEQPVRSLEDLAADVASDVVGRVHPAPSDR